MDIYWVLVLAFPSVDIDSGYYTVKFDSLLLKEAVVEGDSVIPPLRSEEAAESDEDSVDDSGYAKGMSKTALDLCLPFSGTYGITVLELPL